MFKSFIAILIMVILPFTANAKLSDKNKRKTQEMRQEVLTQLYANNPEAKDLIASSEGYAVFNNGGVNLILLSAGSGKGIAHDNKSGQDVYMRMATGGVGLGLGIKDYRTVMVFHKRAMFDQFVERVNYQKIHQLKIAENFSEFLGENVKDEDK